MTDANITVPKPDELLKCLKDCALVIKQTLEHSLGKPDKFYKNKGSMPHALYVYKNKLGHFEITFGIAQDPEYSGTGFAAGHCKWTEILQIAVHDGEDETYKVSKKIRDECLAKCVRVVDPYRKRNNLTTKDLAFTDPMFDSQHQLCLAWRPTNNLLE